MFDMWKNFSFRKSSVPIKALFVLMAISLVVFFIAIIWGTIDQDSFYYFFYPKEKPQIIDNSYVETTDDDIRLLTTEPSSNVIFVNPEGKTVGTLNFGGDEFIFEGDAEESAQIFFDYFLKNMIDGYLEWKRIDDLLKHQEKK